MSQHTTPRSANTSPTMGVAVDGTRFAYRKFGPNTDVPVVFLHHFTAVVDDWGPRVIEGIASERRVITFDNRGVGGPKGRATPTAQTYPARSSSGRDRRRTRTPVSPRDGARQMEATLDAARRHQPCLGRAPRAKDRRTQAILAKLDAR